jgi:enamine deaminase RidA (YjgF/YER057c/UK114 family)
MGKKKKAQRYPEPTVGALILNEKDEVLLVRSHKWRHRYVIPGGHIELGERLEEALQREIAEETGLEIHDCSFIGFQEFIYDDAFWKKRHFLFFDYACRTDMEQVTLNDEGQSYAWVPLDRALTYPIEPYTARAIEHYLEQDNRVARGRRNISSGTMWEDTVGYSRAVRVGNVVHVAGTTSVNEKGEIVGEGDPYEQAAYILLKIEAALKEAGAAMTDVVRTRTYVIDITHWEDVGRAHGEQFQEIRPAATMVEVRSLIRPELLVEIEATAILEHGRAR